MAEAPVDESDFLHELIKGLETTISEMRNSNRAKLDDMQREMTKLKVALAKLETKVAMYAAGGGGGAVGVAEIVRFFI